MIELILVRHAKSDWGDPSLADHDRPLNDRGRRDAPVMADRLAEALAAGGPGAEAGAGSGSGSGSGSGPSSRAAHPRPARIVSSTAVRARSTADALSAALGLPVEPDAGLYLAPAGTLLARAAASGDAAALLVAHDPGLSDLAHRLSDGAIGHLPTCAIARFAWRADSWAEAAARPADAWSLDTPRGRRESRP